MKQKYFFIVLTLLLTSLALNSNPSYADFNTLKPTVLNLTESGKWGEGYAFLLEDYKDNGSLKTLSAILEIESYVGDTSLMLGHAMTLYEESLLAREPVGEILGTYYLGMVYYHLYDDEKASSYFNQCKDLSEKYGIELGNSLSHYGLGLIEYSYENYEPALAHLEAAKSGFDDSEIISDWTLYAEFISYNAFLIDFIDVSIENINTIVSTYQHENWPMRLNTLWDAAIYLNSKGYQDQALPLLEEAAELLESSDFGILSTDITAYLNFDLAYTYYTLGDFENAAKLTLEDAYDYNVKEDVNRVEYLNETLRSLETRDLRETSERQANIITAIGVFLGIISVGTLIIIKEYFKIKRLTQEVQIKSITDGLTGLYNRTAVIEMFENDTHQIKALGVVDIDDFKMINDVYGHATGDWVIKEIASIISKALDGFGYAGRYGGEEFILVIENSHPSDPVELAENIRETIETHQWSSDDIFIPVTVSIGIIRNKTHEFDDAFKVADKLLYVAKNSGKNKVAHVEQ